MADVVLITFAAGQYSVGTTESGISLSPLKRGNRRVRSPLLLFESNKKWMNFSARNDDRRSVVTNHRSKRSKQRGRNSHPPRDLFVRSISA